MHSDASVQRIRHEDRELALVLRHSFSKDGIQFFTPSEYSQQLGYMKRKEGYVIPPHVHNPVPRQVQFTKEVLFIKSGRVRVDFYNDQQVYLESTVLESGDVILLAYGGHGFEMIEESEIIEVKQGPFAGEQDKTRFDPIPSHRIKLEVAQ
jgi:mannose-6-phosphate isomerase-like protein (cupin superfamily)